MLNATDDELIPRACTESLWHAFGVPEIHYYSGGHYKVIRHLISALDRVSRFFAATAGATDVREIARTSEPLTIDGKLDEAAWRAAEPILVDRPHGRAGLIATEAPMVARLLCDEHYLYLGYELRDTDLVATGAEKHLDQAEFFISLGSSTEFWEMHHSAGNRLNNHWCRVPPAEERRKKTRPQSGDVTIDRERFVPDEGQHSVARAVHLLPKADGSPSTLNDPADVDFGYSGEIRFPWSGLGLPAERRRQDGTYRLSGLEVRVLAAALNGNGGQPQTWSSGELPKQKFHFSASRWPRYLPASR
jgi:hypothetical protein